MKKVYVTPQMECTMFEVQNLITSSTVEAGTITTYDDGGITVDAVDLSSDNNWGVLNIW
ncbi:MAG: hypothetical protein ACI4CT_03845 [Lachnospiraceae bacterium]